MKQVAALICALAGSALAAAPATLPRVVNADAWNQPTCGDLVTLDFDWKADSFSVLMPDYYSELSAGDQQDLVSCYLTLSLKMPKNWRMKITNVTWSGSAVAKSGGVIESMYTRSHYWYTKYQGDEIAALRTAAASVVYSNQVKIPSPMIGKEDFDSTFEFSVPSKAENPGDEIPWTPCLSDDSGSMLDFWFGHGVALEGTNGAVASIGKPGRKSDVKVTWSTVWEECDSSKFDPQTYGSPRG